MRRFPIALGPLLLASTALAQVPAGPEFVVNAYTTDEQREPAVASDRHGNFVVAWRSNGQDGSGYGIVARRFDASGAPLADDFIVNSYTTGIQIHPAVAVGREGAFIIAWHGDGAAGRRDLYARRFDRRGEALGAEFRVNDTYTNGNEAFPAVAIDASGRAVIAWRSVGTIASARRFAADGTPLGPEFVVRNPPGGVESGPDVSSSAAGVFVVVWTERNGIQATDVRGQRYDASGNPLGGAFLVNEVAADTYGRFAPVVAMAPEDAFTVAWGSVRNSYPVGSFEVLARRFTAQGTPIGGEFLVNTYTTDDQKTPAIAMSAVGDFVVTWNTVSPPPFTTDRVSGQRFDRNGTPRGAEFQVDMATAGRRTSYPGALASDDNGNFVVAWRSHDGFFYGAFGRRFGGLHAGRWIADPWPGTPISDGNGVVEPGEGVELRTAWRNTLASAVLVEGEASGITVPGTSARIDHDRATYDIAAGDTETCVTTALLQCFLATIDAPAARPSVHWDGTFREDILPPQYGQTQTWTVHLGDSFGDVPRANPFYRFVETLLHHGVTAGCAAASYCPGSSTTRAQMAVFVVVAAEGSAYAPPACGTPMFPDVPASSPFCPWIEELARRGVVGGCGGGSYCPAAPVSREQMAVFALRTREAAFIPPPCGTPMFADVPASSPFCRWIEELARRGVVSGCGGGNYCPAASLTREQMAVFITATFDLQLYGP